MGSKKLIKQVKPPTVWEQYWNQYSGSIFWGFLVPLFFLHRYYIHYCVRRQTQPRTTVHTNDSEQQQQQQQQQQEKEGQPLDSDWTNRLEELQKLLKQQEENKKRADRLSDTTKTATTTPRAKTTTPTTALAFASIKEEEKGEENVNSVLKTGEDNVMLVASDEDDHDGAVNEPEATELPLVDKGAAAAVAAATGDITRATPDDNENHDGANGTAIAEVTATFGEDDNNALARHRATVARGRRVRTSTTTTTTISTRKPPKMETTNHHPGMDNFWQWHHDVTDQYRSIVVAKTSTLASFSLRSGGGAGGDNYQTDHEDLIPPFIPRSERGNVKVSLTVVNHTSRIPIDAFWIDYQGKEVYKGSANSTNSVWDQTTWIGHPWVFRSTGGRIIFYYIPYRIIPTTARVNTVSEDPDIGEHRLEILDNTRNTGGPYREVVRVRDSVSVEADTMYKNNHDNNGSGNNTLYPHHAVKFMPAIHWCLDQMARDEESTGIVGNATAMAQLLLKYLYNIVLHPDESKYRQIRTCNAAFAQVWNNFGARGVLLALGFVENRGYAEMGSPSKVLSRDRIEQVGMAIHELELFVKQEIQAQEADAAAATVASADAHHHHHQPQGADGYGRAGFGRAGNMNNF